jgi:ABC-2 type transport system permease protein
VNAGTNIKTIAKRELGAYFSSPLAYVLIVIFLLFCSAFTFLSDLGNFFGEQQAALGRSFFRWHPWFYLFLVPAVGMRLWAEERRTGTIELLLTMPITAWQAIVGKFIASWLFLGVALALTFPVVITVNYLGSPDNGVILTGYLGSWFMAGAYLAISCMMSAITRNQVISFISSLAICFVLVLCGYGLVSEMFQGTSFEWFGDAIANLGFFTHYDGFQKGVLDSRDIVYFLSVIGFSLFTTGVILRSHRAG